MDVELLSRLQFAGTIMFHYLFPPLSIGLGLQLFLCELAYFRTGNPAWEAAARFWTRVFAVNFALGVATGLVMEFEFGTNWAAYSRFVGDVFGSALAAEGIFAFFLESGFLAVLVFGWDRVGPRMHLFSTLMVFLGSVFSAVWIVVANSWQQTPAGYHIVWHDVQGEMMPRAEVTDFWAMVLNPSSVDRLTHTLIGALVLGAFFVASVCSYYLLTGRHQEVARRCLVDRLANFVTIHVLAVVTGHDSAQKFVETQPAKLAAMEAHFRTTDEPTGLYLFGWPDAENENVRFGAADSNVLSLMVYNDPTDPVPGLDQIPSEDRPPVWLPFQTFHLMVGLGTLMIIVSTWRVGHGIAAPVRTTTLATVGDRRDAGRRNDRQPSRLGHCRSRPATVDRPSIGTEWCGNDGPANRRRPQRIGNCRSSTQFDHSVWGHLLLLFAVWVFVLNNKIQHGPESPEELAEQKRRRSRRFLVGGD